MRLSFCAFLMLLAAVSANSATLYFGWIGGHPTEGYTAVENGSFSFADGLTSVTLSDLTAFSMTGVENFQGYHPPPAFLEEADFSLANLQSFSLAFVPNSRSVDSFQMLAVNPSLNSISPSFTIVGGKGSVNEPFTALLGGAGGFAGSLYFSDNPTALGPYVYDHGQLVPVASVPEPTGTALLCLTGVAALLLSRPTRRIY